MYNYIYTKIKSKIFNQNKNKNQTELADEPLVQAVIKL